jgi:hypothetical protein
MISPISFSIPEEKLCAFENAYTCKTKILSNLIPGDTTTYIYNTEEDYYNEYKKSYFATTTKKAGWDCMRHYEILANGCIPYFIDIEQCPPRTMHLCPKQLFLEANALYNQFKIKNIDSLTDDDKNKYYALLRQLYDYTKNHLTTYKMAKYILRMTRYENVSKILYLSGSTYPDYLRCLTLHGFKKIFGANCHDFPKIPHMYKSHNVVGDDLYGMGFTYSGLLDNSTHNDRLDKSIEEDIKNKYYDIVIYGSFHRGLPHYDLVSNVYKSNEIILLCGEDIHACCYADPLKYGYNMFVREL